MSIALRHTAGRSGQRTALPSLPSAGGHHRARRPASLASLLAPVAARIRLKPFDTLFEVGEAVRRFHVVESGCLLVTLSSQGTPTLIRLARAGDLVVGDVGGIRVTTCHAIEASTLLSVERKQMARAAACDGRIAEALRRVHERELETLLASGWRADVPSQIVAGAAAERTVASGAHGTPSHGRDAARGALEAIA